MNRLRLSRLEEKLKSHPICHRVDPETGWHIIGGGKGARGFLYCPPVLTPDEWLAAGKAP